MNLRLWFLAITPVGFFVCLPLTARPPFAVGGPEKLPAPRVAPLASQYLGAGSCAASACHNSSFRHTSKEGEYTTWMTDPHARAYAVLFDKRSKNIQKHLGRAAPAHEEQRCLKCHVAPDFDAARAPPDAPPFKIDGVSCESCHGPAKEWINHHHLDAWRFTTPTEKKKLGMYDTQSLVSRVRLCVRCHVGEAGMDVDHDLIAAGHPRLNFEFAAFHAHMPRHWPDAKDEARVKGDFQTHAWVVGQLAAAQASMALLAERTGNPANPWPEFAEFDCAACHRDLQSSGPRQKAIAKRKAGAYPWGHSIALTPLAFDQIVDKDALHAKTLGKRRDSLQRTMDAGNPSRKAVNAEASEAATLLQAALDRLGSNPESLTPVQEKLRAFLATREARAADGTDERTHLYLALTAVHDSRGDLAKQLRPLTPHSFDPQAIQQRLLRFKDLNGNRR